MALILNIETATTNCSVSLSENGKAIITKEINEGFTHAENLHSFISDILNNTKITPQQLNAIAVSKGPGSYTGLRIGVSAAKGLCYALSIPLIGINTLQIMSAVASQKNTTALLCPMLDARRMEVYTAIYDQQLNEVRPTEALIVDENSIQQFANETPICFFGDGMPKCKNLLSDFKQHIFIDDVIPSAEAMSNLSDKLFKEQKFEDVAYFEPFYLKDFMIIKKQQ